MKKISFSLLI